MLILGALNGVSKEELLSDHFTPVTDVWKENIRAAWRDKIEQHELIVELAEKLFTQGAA